MKLEAVRWTVRQYVTLWHWTVSQIQGNTSAIQGVTCQFICWNNNDRVNTQPLGQWTNSILLLWCLINTHHQKESGAAASQWEDPELVVRSCRQDAPKHLPVDFPQAGPVETLDTDPGLAVCPWSLLVVFQRNDHYSGHHHHHQSQNMNSDSFSDFIISLHSIISVSWNISLKCDHRGTCRQFEGCVHWTQYSRVHLFPDLRTCSQTTKGKARMSRSLLFIKWKNNKENQNTTRITAKD